MAINKSLVTQEAKAKLVNIFILTLGQITQNTVLPPFPKSISVSFRSLFLFYRLQKSTFQMAEKSVNAGLTNPLIVPSFHMELSAFYVSCSTNSALLEIIRSVGRLKIAAVATVVHQRVYVKKKNVIVCFVSPK